MHVQYLLTPELFLKHFGLVGFLGILAIFFLTKFRYRRFAVVLTLTVVIILLLTFAKEAFRLYAGIDLGYQPAQQKFGKPIFLVAVILFALFFQFVLGLFKKYSILTRSVLTVFFCASLVYFICPGVQGTWSFAEVSRLKNAKWQQNERKQLIENKRLFSNLEEIISFDSIVAVPEEMQNDFALLSGLNVLFHDHLNSFSYDRKIASAILFASAEKRNKLLDFLSLTNEQLYGSIILQFGIDLVIYQSKSSYKFEKLKFFKELAGINWRGKEYKIYEVMNIDQTIEWNSQIFSVIQNSIELQSMLLGYIHLKAKRSIVPGIYNIRNIKIEGLASDGRFLWLSDEFSGRLYKIDPKSGKVVRFLKNPVDHISGLAFGNDYLWCLDKKKKLVFKIDSRNGKILDAIKTPALNPVGLTWDAGYLWNINSVRFDQPDIKIFKIPTNSNFNLTESFALCPPMSYGLVYHDGYLWVNRKWHGKIYKIDEDNKKPIQVIKDVHYYNKKYIISKITWHNRSLWGYDDRNNVLVEFKVK